MDSYTHRVRYHEVDAQGFMFNGRFFEVADVAMSEFFRSLGWPYPEMLSAGLDPSVVQASVTFKRPARFEDVLVVKVRCTRVGTSSFQLDMDVIREVEDIAHIELVYVNVDAESATSRPIPVALAEALRAPALSAGGPNA